MSDFNSNPKLKTLKRRQNLIYSKLSQKRTKNWRFSTSKKETPNKNIRTFIFFYYKFGFSCWQFLILHRAHCRAVCQTCFQFPLLSSPVHTPRIRQHCFIIYSLSIHLHIPLVVRCKCHQLSFDYIDADAAGVVSIFTFFFFYYIIQPHITCVY